MEKGEKNVISVIMGIYNCATTLNEALDSIANQTYTNWEIIMCDDGSKDDTYAVAKAYQEKYPEKIVLLQNEENLGLNATLNKCLMASKGEFIARMDGDDLCSSERFEKEIKILEENPDIAIVSTDMEMFDETGTWGRTHKEEYPTKKSFLRGTPFCHAPCLVRREAYLAVEGYTIDERLLRVEDYHLWMKMYAKGYTGINILECLYQMRDDHNAQARRGWKSRRNEAYVKKCAIKQLKLPFYNYIFCLRPLLVGLTPSWLYKRLHRRKFGEGK